MDKETENPRQQLDLHKNQILAPLQVVGTPLQVEKQPKEKEESILNPITIEESWRYIIIVLIYQITLETIICGKIRCKKW